MTNPYVKTVVICSQCGKQRGEANHWFYIVRQSYTSPLFPEETPQTPKFGLLISTWANDEPAAEWTLPICGDQCLSAVVSKFAEEAKAK